ncbi:MAG: hypothetical protein E7043_10345 [Lentisphaerae bacterium]|nr:hypothetical protein [Lentisphaerota bacterium]
MSDHFSFRNREPYAGINWQKTCRIMGCTHLHCTDNAALQKLFADGLEFVTLSNYHPSAPWYPLHKMRKNQFQCRQKGYTFNGVYHDEEVDFSEKIMQWRDSLAPEFQSQLPFTAGEAAFSGIPENILEAPNAEHHSFTNAVPQLHITAPGTTFVSGHFDDRADNFGLAERGFACGTGLTWQEGFKRILDTLVIPDGGGIIINHPAWSYLRQDFLIEMLDNDPRVLGLEVYNGTGRKTYADFSDPLWDAVLATGRQCYGFCAVDHLKNNAWNGRIVILAAERSAAGCLRALRQGQFYGMIRGSGAAFEEITFDGRTLRARCNREMYFQLISKTGIAGQGNGREFFFTVPENERGRHVFLRLTAHEFSTREKLFAQPVMLV